MLDSIGYPIVKYQWLQAARGIAVIGVLLFHVSSYWEDMDIARRITGPFHWGFLGVDLFFVLSGFVISASIERKSGGNHALHFICLRFARIYLGYWPALALFCFVAYLQGVSLPTGNALTSIFLLSGKIPDHWLAISWSLFFELYFYGLAALVIAVVPMKQRKRWITLFMALIASWNAGWLITAADEVMAGLQPRRTLLSGLILEFLLGCLLYEMRSLFSYSFGKVANLASLAMVTFAIGTFSHWFDKIELLRVGTFGLSAAAIIAMALCMEHSPYKPAKWLTFTGDCSYSIYLTHIVVLDIAATLGRLLLPADSWMFLLNSLLVPAYAWLFGALWYRCLEHPLYMSSKRLIGNLLSPRHTRIPAKAQETPVP
nr:acyltransferase [Pseudomonas sp. RIT-PI-AD]